MMEEQFHLIPMIFSLAIQHRELWQLLLLMQVIFPQKGCHRYILLIQVMKLKMLQQRQHKELDPRFLIIGFREIKTLCSYIVLQRPKSRRLMLLLLMMIRALLLVLYKQLQVKAEKLSLSLMPHTL